MPLHEPRMGNEMREEEYDLKELLEQSEGFERYAATKMPEFIQVVRDYEGFVRDVITVTEVSNEDLTRFNEEVYVTYSKDIDATAAVMPREGEVPSLIIKGDTVKVDFYEIATPRLTITQWDLDTQPYDLMRRTQEKAGQAMARIEDEEFLKVVNMLVENTPKQQAFQAETAITKAGLLSVKKIFSRNNVAFSSYLMNPATYDDFLLWGEDDLDEVSQRTVLETGELPTIWGGIKMVTGIIVEEKYVYGLSPKEVLGRMPILRDVTMDVQRIPETKDKEVLAYEFIGMFIHDAKAVARLELGATGPKKP